MRKKNVFGFLLLLFSSLIFITCYREDDSIRVYYDDLLENHLDSAVIVAETTKLDSLSEKGRAFFARFCAEVNHELFLFEFIELSSSYLYETLPFSNIK